MRAAYGEAFRSRLRPQTLRDIAGLDVTACGFGRPECCGPIPKGIAAGKRMGMHVYFSTSMPLTEWASHSENIPGCMAVQAAVARKFPQAGFTAFYDSAGADTNQARLLRFDPLSALTSVGSPEEYMIPIPRSDDPKFTLPQKSTSTGRSLARGDCFIFICSHRQRDARCGYCGPILADLLEQVFEKSTDGVEGVAQEHPLRVSVHRCAHVGGHIYAGNVLIYSRHGAVTYGLVTPDDLEVLANAVLEDKGRIPPQLRARVRGASGYDLMDP